ncbi:MAG TPA: hypothetical protein PK653_11140 [Syntrophales bacterium]|nr:hypothetical protein [Syntrophales bacterium]
MKKTLSALLILMIALTWLTSAGAEQTINNCPIPDDMKIVAPDKNEVPPKLALLSGIWEGNWGPMSVLFIVEKILKDEVVVIHSYSGGRLTKFKSIEPKYFRKKCPVELGDDGNYRIIMELKAGTNRLIQINDPNSIRVVREGFTGSGWTADMKDSMFRRKEMK